MVASSLRALALLPIVLLCGACASGQEISPAAVLPPADGAALFGRHCAACHGSRGEGDGPVAAVMEVAVPNLRTLRTRARGEFPRDTVMRYIDGRNLPAAHGERLMPVWGDTFAAASDDPQQAEAYARQQIAAIADFVEALQN